MNSHLEKHVSLTPEEAADLEGAISALWAAFKISWWYLGLMHLAIVSVVFCHLKAHRLLRPLKTRKLLA